MSKNRYLYEDVQDLQEAWDALMQPAHKQLEDMVIRLSYLIIRLSYLIIRLLLKGK